MHTDHEREQPERNQRDAVTPFPIPVRIPVFPLPNVVLFPKTYLPLHIFEPRYRTMVADAALSGQCIGMVLLKEGWETASRCEAGHVLVAHARDWTPSLTIADGRQSCQRREVSAV